MASEALRRFADDLKSARELKGISILQISLRTKIDSKFLTAIENAEFDILPDIYVRAFIKSYSQSIDLNPKEILQKFENAKTGITEQPPVVIIEPITTPALQQEEKPTGKFERKLTNTERLAAEANAAKVNTSFQKEFGAILEVSSKIVDEEKMSYVKKNLNIIIGVIVVLAALAVLYFTTSYESSPDIVTDQDQLSYQENSARFEVNKPETPISQDSISSKKQINTSTGLKLRVQNSGQVWIKVLCDGKIVHQGIVQKDSTLDFNAAKKFAVSVGNAGAVKLFFNDKLVPNVGKTGEIRNITMTPDTIRYLTIRRNETQPSNKN